MGLRFHCEVGGGGFRLIIKHQIIIETLIMKKHINDYLDQSLNEKKTPAVYTKINRD